MIFQYSISFLMGLQATLHCVGMCGPLAFAAPINRKNKKAAIWGSITYNFGRITTYSYLGFLIGLIGIGNAWIHAIQILSVLTGVILLATLDFGSPETWPFWRSFIQKIGKISGFLFPFIKQADPKFRPFLFGTVNGLLPCGMVYTALFHALASSSTAETVLSMVFFGLGTLPFMFFIPLIGQERFYQLFPRKAYKAMLLAIGILLILRGMGLGIPYLSPRVQLPASPHSQPTIECCDMKP